MPQQTSQDMVYVSTLFIFSQAASAFCFYKRGIALGIFAWAVGWIIAIVYTANTQAQPPKPPEGPPPADWFGGPRNGY